jgi:phosphatidylglycerophosphate synthase
VADTLIVPFWQACPAPDLRLLGVKFKDRIVLPARKSGFENVVLSPSAEDINRFPREFLILRPNLLLSEAAWKQLNGLASTPDSLTMIRQTDSIALLGCEHVRFLSDAFRSSGSFDELLEILSHRMERKLVSIGNREWVDFRSESDRPKVEKWLLSGLMKDSESFMSRHVERRISLAVTRTLAETPISPNIMSLVSGGIGLAGAICFALPQGSHHVLGSLLFWLHSVLDGCDGELARLKFAESRSGGLLDFWGDNVVHSAVFSAIALRMSFKKPGRTPFVLAALAVGGTLFSAGWVYWTTMRRQSSRGPLFTSVLGELSRDNGSRSTGEKIAERLGSRDFIYLVIVLASIGKIEWFLWMAAAGAPLYFLVLTGLSLKNSLPSGPRLAF